MNVSLTPTLEKLVQKKVNTGLYNSASEVVREALRLMDKKDKLSSLKLKELKKDLAIGIEQANQGKLLDGKEVFKKLRMHHKKSGY